MTEKFYLEQSSETNFQEIKTVASENISSIVKDFQDFEAAIQSENMPAIYRIYQGRLHEQLKTTANQHNEIDELMMRKIHDNFLLHFPFMQLSKKVSPTMNYYQLGSYYHERPTFAIDASIPEIFLLPEIEEEWLNQKNRTVDTLKTIEERMDALDAMTITAQQELDEVDEQLSITKKVLLTKKEETKGFFNRTKSEEEFDDLNKKIFQLEKKKEELGQFIEDKQSVDNERQELMNSYQFSRLKKAIITKELRLISRYFHSYEEMGITIQQFLENYLSEETEEM